MQSHTAKSNFFAGFQILITLVAMSASLLLARTLEKEYTSILGRLFKPVRLIPRHSTGALSEAFLLRKSVFQDLYALSHVCHTCRVVHVAGTKGKGSTVEFISSSLVKNGNLVGVFTSPHLHTARERVRVGRDLISQADMIRLGQEAIEFLSEQSWTVFFDLLLALSIKYFAEKKVEYMILESGIGGRYDTTNFIENPAACVITSISLDHQQLLGETIEEIAWQKAGIIKPNSHVFTPATQQPSVLQVFRDECARVQATLHEVPVGRAYLAEHLSCDTDVQVENACLSLAVLQHLEVPPTGWDKFYWPCRMEPFAFRGATVVLDGCHNGLSVQKFLEGLRHQYKGKAIKVLFGAGHEKCLRDMLNVVLSASDKVTMVQSKHFKAMTEKELLTLVPPQHLSVLDMQQQQQQQGIALEHHSSIPLSERLEFAVRQSNPNE